jgi:colicin import membrane protein
MPSATDRLEFAPPPPPGILRAFGLAVIAHILLLLALTWGVNWKRDTDTLAVEAELWSSIPQQAAPRLAEVQPPPQPKVIETPKVIEPPRPPPPVVKEAQIAVEREKPKPKPEKKPPPKPEPKPEPKPKPLPKPEPVKKPVEATKPKVDDSKRQIELQRQENLKHMAGLAGAAGEPSATGTVRQSSGPSANYKGRLAALFKRNIVFPGADSISGNPKTVVQVKVSSTGLILSSRVTKTSGVPAWDDAVLRAVERAERIPLDENGKVVTDFPVEFGPKD